MASAGGILGASTIFHLTRLGWSDVVLIEKAELTAGSTWHAAGMVPGFAECALIARIMRESMDTYLNLEELTGSPSGAHRCGSIRLAHNRDEEKEHAAMVLEWIRRRDEVLTKELKDYLFTDGKPIADLGAH